MVKASELLSRIDCCERRARSAASDCVLDAKSPLGTTRIAAFNAAIAAGCAEREAYDAMLSIVDCAEVEYDLGYERARMLAESLWSACREHVVACRTAIMGG